MIIGTVTTFTRKEFFETSNPSEIINYKLMIPTYFILTLFIISVHNTIKRKEFFKLFLNLAKVNNAIPNPKPSGNKTTQFSIAVFIIFLVVIHVAVLIFETWYWRMKSNVYYEALVRICKLFYMSLMVLHSSAANIVKMKLNTLTETFTRNNLRIWENSLKKPRYISLVDVSNVWNIRKIRQDYSLIYDTTQVINDVFSVSTLLVVVVYFITLLNNMYTFYELLNIGEDFGKKYFDKGRVVLVVFWVVHVVASLFVISYSAQLAAGKAKQLGEQVQRQLLLSSRDLEELKLFANQLYYNKIEFSAIGFNLNLRFFCTFIMSAYTYVLVIIQFK